MANVIRMSTALLNLLFAQTIFKQLTDLEHTSSGSPDMSSTQSRGSPSPPAPEFFIKLSQDLKLHPLNSEFNLSPQACQSLYNALLPQNPTRPTGAMLRPLLGKLYESYKKDIVERIREDELEYRTKLKEIEQIENGVWDGELLKELEMEQKQGTNGGQSQQIQQLKQQQKLHGTPDQSKKQGADSTFQSQGSTQHVQQLQQQKLQRALDQQKKQEQALMIQRQQLQRQQQLELTQMKQMQMRQREFQEKKRMMQRMNGETVSSPNSTPAVTSNAALGPTQSLQRSAVASGGSDVVTRSLSPVSPDQRSAMPQVNDSNASSGRAKSETPQTNNELAGMGNSLPILSESEKPYSVAEGLESSKLDETAAAELKKESDLSNPSEDVEMKDAPDMSKPEAEAAESTTKADGKSDEKNISAEDTPSAKNDASATPAKDTDEPELAENSPNKEEQVEESETKDDIVNKGFKEDDSPSAESTLKPESNAKKELTEADPSEKQDQTQSPDDSEEVAASKEDLAESPQSDGEKAQTDDDEEEKEKVEEPVRVTRSTRGAVKKQAEEAEKESELLADKALKERKRGKVQKDTEDKDTEEAGETGKEADDTAQVDEEQDKEEQDKEEQDKEEEPDEEEDESNEVPDETEVPDVKPKETKPTVKRRTRSSSRVRKPSAPSKDASDDVKIEVDSEKEPDEAEEEEEQDQDEGGEDNENESENEKDESEEEKEDSRPTRRKFSGRRESVRLKKSNSNPSKGRAAKGAASKVKAEETSHPSTPDAEEETPAPDGTDNEEDNSQSESDAPATHRTRAQSLTRGTKKRKRTSSPARSAMPNRRFLTMVNPLLSNISSNKSASFFANPVNPNDAPNYYSLIYDPTDIRTIKSQVKDGRIKDTAELERELQRMFANAVMYNGWDSDVSVWTREMQHETETLLALFRGAERTSAVNSQRDEKEGSVSDEGHTEKRRKK